MMSTGEPILHLGLALTLPLLYFSL
jgi:hypothetical protein